MNGMGVALVLVMTVVACAAVGVVTWGLILEARSNRTSATGLKLSLRSSG